MNNDNNIQQMIEKEFKEPELTGMQFECIDTNGDLFVAKADEIEVGTLILVEYWEAFRITETSDQKPWITYIGGRYTHLQFAGLMRQWYNKPKIIHWGL